jgi:hypothetical protein
MRQMVDVVFCFFIIPVIFFFGSYIYMTDVIQSLKFAHLIYMCIVCLFDLLQSWRKVKSDHCLGRFGEK